MSQDSPKTPTTIITEEKFRELRSEGWIFDELYQPSTPITWENVTYYSKSTPFYYKPDFIASVTHEESIMIASMNKEERDNYAAYLRVKHHNP